jgi:caffeoyl-CoA O-methyltransferase
MEIDLEKYILNISSGEDPLLHELYRKTYTSVVNPNMVSGHLQGKLLEMLVSMINPDIILEIGTFTGYSAISMARSLKENGKLLTIEVNDELDEISSEYIRRSGFGEKIIQYTGDAKEIIPQIEESFDLAFIDGDKREYPLYYDMVIDKLKPGGFILADNVLWDGKVTDEKSDDPMTMGIKEFNRKVRDDSRVENILLPVRDGLMLIRKKQH